MTVMQGRTADGMLILVRDQADAKEAIVTASLPQNGWRSIAELTEADDFVIGRAADGRYLIVDAFETFDATEFAPFNL